MDDELKGIPVLVHPRLENDPAGKQNQIGTIILADIENDEVFVSFDDNSKGLYSTDALLALLPADEIHQHLADNAFTLAMPDLKALTQIDLLLHYGSPQYRLGALQLARQNDSIRLFCLDTVHNQLGPEQTKHLKR
jgi:hypothetical protein